MKDNQKNFHLVYFHSSLNHCFTFSFNLSWLKAINCRIWRCFKASYLAVILTTVCVNISYFVFDVCCSCYCESLWQEPCLFSPSICTFFFLKIFNSTLQELQDHYRYHLPFLPYLRPTGSACLGFFKMATEFNVSPGQVSNVCVWTG